jgi:hypothetical protein
MRLALLFGLLLLPFALVACGGSGDSDPTPIPSPTNSPDSSPAATPVVVDDEGYLAVVCSGLSAFSDAVLVAKTADEISAVVRQYIADLEQVSPPEDVMPFHQGFIQYLSDSVDEPTVLLTNPPPLPEQSVRQRLAGKESSVSECRNLVLFGEREGES